MSLCGCLPRYLAKGAHAEYAALNNGILAEDPEAHPCSVTFLIEHLCSLVYGLACQL